MSLHSAARPRKPAINVRKALSRADRARRAGDVAVAACSYGDVLARFPSNVHARRAMADLGPKAALALVEKAKTCQGNRHLDQAERLWAGAAALCPDHVGIGLSLTRCRSDMGRSHDALEAVDKLLNAVPGDPSVLDAKGCILRDLGQPDAAEQCHREALKNSPEQDEINAGPLNHLGILARANNDLDKAAMLFRQAIALSPATASLHHNLAGCVRYQAKDPHIRQMQDQITVAPQNDPQAAPLHFALFKALDDLDDREAAFAHLIRGNQLRKAGSNFDIAGEARRFAWYKSLFTQPAAPVCTKSTGAPRPVFVVGLPRSGTTLVERILGQASETQTAGELSVVANAVAPMLRQLQTQDRAAPTPEDLQALRYRLQSGLSQHSNGAPILVDKMPLNFRWAGLICAALPEARIVSLTRAPMPVAWSLFRHLFSSRGNGFAYDMADIAAYTLLHRDLMQFWSGRFADQIIALDYAALVDETEQTTRNLIQACDLKWTDACLSPQSAAGPVLTASASQVRQGIYGGSDESWHRYEAQLAPLSKALQEIGMT